MRILCLTNMWPSPGAPDYGAFVEAMCRALEARGAQVEVAAIDTRARGALRTPAKYARLARDAARRARGCDVVYAHYLVPTGTIAAAACRRAGVPWVLTAHGGDVRAMARAPLRAAAAPGITGAAAVIAVSRFVAADLRATGVQPRRMVVANMGVDMERFTPGDRAAARGRLGLPARGPLVLAVGGLTERKNPLTLLQAMLHLRARRPDARLAFVGTGPLAGAIRAGVRRLGLDGAVALAGAVPNAEVAEWMAAADVLAMPSRVEPLGVVALEALASGRPVVATRVGGAAEVVPGRGPGRIVDPLDPGAIAVALEEVLAAPPDPAACRAVAAASSLTRQAARVEAVLTEAAGRA